MSEARPATAHLRVIAIAAGTALFAIAAVLRHRVLERNAVDLWRGRMETGADATRQQVQTWLEDHQADSRILAQEAAAHRQLFEAVGRPADAAARAALVSNLTVFAGEKGYLGAWAIDRDGRIIAASDRVVPMDPSELDAARNASVEGISPITGPYATDDGSVRLGFVAPVTVSNGASGFIRIGAVVLLLDPYRTLFQIVLRDPSGIATPHHRLVAHIGDEYVNITPSKDPPAGPLALRVPWRNAPTVGRLAVTGTDTAGRFTDARNRIVVAATRHIPETGWGIIRGISEPEAIAAARTEFWVELAMGAVLYALVTVSLIAWRRRARLEQLRVVGESEARYRLLAENATDIIIREDPSGRYQYVSPACRQLLGYEPQELMGLAPESLFHPDDGGQVAAFRSRARNEPGAVTATYRMRRKDGQYAWFETTSRAVRDPETRQVQELVTVSREITARKNAEDHAARLARYNELILTSAGEGIFGIDLNGQITFVNPAGARMFGREPRDLLGRDEHSLLHHTRADGSPYPKSICQVCASTRDRLVHHESNDVFWRRDGSSFTVEYVSTPIIEQGDILGAVITFRDVSERRRTEKELVQAKEAAEAANHAKSNFLARMSHELRTPLNSVIGFANLIQKNKAETLASQDLLYLDRITTNGRHLLGLINDILDLSKIESGKTETEITAVAVGALIHDVVSQLGGRLNKDGVTLRADVPDSLAMIDTDGDKLRQILINLVGNALKFTESGSVTVRVEAEPTGRPTLISVIDTGIGIPPDRQKVIFDPFEQADNSTTRKYGGTGLGLSISRALCDLLGYQLKLESKLDAGSTFTIVLGETPAATVAAAAASSAALRSAAMPQGAAPARLAEAIANLPATGGRIVLTIDDEEDARVLLTEHLKELGYRVVTAASGQEGLQIARSLHPDLITLDLMMPGMSGWEVLKRLSADPALRNIPVVIVSAVAAGERRQHLLGVVDFLAKPIGREELATALERNVAGGAPSVLVVEDDPDARHILTRYIRDGFGCTVRTATNGREALEELATHVPELVILDLHMPVMNGVTFLRTMRGIPRYARLPVIAVTAHTTTNELRTYLRQETIALLEKGEHLEADLGEQLRHVFGPGAEASHASPLARGHAA